MNDSKETHMILAVAAYLGDMEQKIRKVSKPQIHRTKSLIAPLTASEKENRCAQICLGEKHSHYCPVGIDKYNQGLNTRQSRRYRARIMAKRGDA